MTTNILYTTPLTTSLYKQHKSQSPLIQTIGTTSEAVMISALAGSHILHINPASVSAMPSQANRPTSTVTNKHVQESQMVCQEVLSPFPELGTLEGGSLSQLQVVFPGAPGSCDAVCEEAKKHH